MTHWAVILAGGVGSRFWPVSTPRRPKQLLALVDEAPLLANTVNRLLPLVGVERVLIIANESLADAIARLVTGLPRENILAEPRSASTAPALSWAAVEIQRRTTAGAESETVMMCVHSDWAIGDPEEFRATLMRAAVVAARLESLVTVGIVPTRPDPGFGYIQPGRVADGARRVKRFVEKPNRARAQRMVRAGYLWNSGIFVWRAGDFLHEVRQHTPEVSGALHHAESGDIARFFREVTAISVDQGVLERSDRVLVLPGNFGWDDVGTWSALRRVRTLDSNGNAANGPVHLIESRDNVVHAEGGGNAVVLYGVSDLVVVSRNGLTLVTTTERATDLKKLVEELPADLREDS